MMPATSEDVAVLRVGKWRVDPALDEISSEGRRTVRLEPLAMRLLLCLARHAGRPVELQQLLDEVWTGVVVAPGSVYQAIAQLRRNLGDDTEHPTYIDTVPRKGYRLIAPVSPWVTGITNGAQPDLPATPTAPTPSSESQHVAPERASPPLTEPAPGVHVPPRRMKWRTQPVLAAVVLVAAVVAALTWLVRTAHPPAGLTATVASSEKSIAVLPFVDLSEKKDQEYFADGMAEEILDVLARVPNLRVMARTSSFQFKGRNEDIRTIGAQLNVAYVLEGSVRRSGDQVRITAQLIDTRNGSHRWSGSYDRDVGAVLALQNEVATGVARALQVTLGADELRSRPPTVRPEAYDNYLRGRNAMDQMTEAGWERATVEFQKALDLDPSFTPAAEWLAQTDILLADFVPDPEGHRLEAARQAALAAVRLDPNSASAHAVLGNVYTNFGDWAASARELSLGRRLEPRNLMLLWGESVLAMTRGRWEEAIQFLNSARDADPLTPVGRQLAEWAYLGAHRLKEAEAEIRKALQISPDLDTGHYDLALILLAQGQREAALKEIEREVDDQSRDAGLAIIHFTMGHKSDSDAALARLIASSSKSWAGGISQVYAARGELDQAFAWLDRAYAQKDVDLRFIRCYLPWAPLREDPRYRAFLKKMNLPE